MMYGVGLFGGPPQAEPKGSGTRRLTYRICHEAFHYVLEEQTRRKDLGLPHTALSDILNDWILEHAKCLGRKSPTEAADEFERSLREGLDKLPDEGPMA